MKIVLIGFIGVGKTQTGKALASILQIPFFDLDEMIEAASGLSVASVISRQGLEQFREMEFKTLDGIIAKEPFYVIATGGGTLTYLPSRVRIKQTSLAVWLKADPDTIWRRLQNKPYVAPLFFTKHDPLMAIREEMSRRERYYKEVAHVAVTVDGKTPGDLAGEIKKTFNGPARG